MAISLQADSTQPRGYISIDGVPGVTITQTTLSANTITTSSGSVDARVATLSSVSTSLSSTGMRRAFENSGQPRYIYIDSLLGNDATADGTAARPFKEILPAVEFYAKFCESRGNGVVFKLVGQVGNPRTYKGTHVYFHPARTGVSGATSKDPGVLANIGAGDPATYMSVDRAIFFQGNLENPETVIIEPIFYRNRGLGGNYYGGQALRIEAPGSAVTVEGITFRYNAVGRLPNYTGNDPLYNETVDYYAHLEFITCHYCTIGRCILTGCYNSDTEPSPGYGATASQASKYMLGLVFYGCTYPRLKNITVTGSLRYIMKVGGAGAGIDIFRLEHPGVITLQNNPRFYGIFELENGSGIYLDWITGNPNWVWVANATTNYPEYVGPYSLSFVGNCGTVRAGTNWQNWSILNFENGQSQYGKNYLRFPNSVSSPAFNWPGNVQRRPFIHDGMVTWLNMNLATQRTVGYEYVALNDNTVVSGASRNV